MRKALSIILLYADPMKSKHPQIPWHPHSLFCLALKCSESEGRIRTFSLLYISKRSALYHTQGQPVQRAMARHGLWSLYPPDRVNLNCAYSRQHQQHKRKPRGFWNAIPCRTDTYIEGIRQLQLVFLYQVTAWDKSFAVPHP